MTQPNESHSSAPTPTDDPPAVADKAPTPMQRAVMERARTAAEPSRFATKPSLRLWIVALLLAIIPVFITFALADFVLRVVHTVMTRFVPATAPVPAPASTPVDPSVVLLQPYSNASKSVGENPTQPPQEAPRKQDEAPPQQRNR